MKNFFYACLGILYVWGRSLFDKINIDAYIIDMNIFCNVIDNYGDAGFCLRLSRDLTYYGQKVCIYCDYIDIFNKILTDEDKINPNLLINRWPISSDSYQSDSVVIELFSCRLDSFVMDKVKENNSLLIALDYFSCEKWPEDFHLRPSYSENKESFFFFPGVSTKTGSIIIDDSYRRKIKNKIRNNKNRNRNRIKVSLFSYFNPQIKNLITDCLSSKYTYEFIVFEGKALDNLNQLLNLSLKVNDTYKQNNLSFYISPMVSQSQYDDLLLQSDLNLVRGEDSIVRAMLAGRPFLWQIYHQESNTHLIKLNSLFDRMLEYLDSSFHESVEEIRQLNLQYVENENTFKNNTFYIENLIIEHKKTFLAWSEYLLSLPSLTQNLISFIKTKNIHI